MCTYIYIYIYTCYRYMYIYIYISLVVSTISSTSMIILVAGEERRPLRGPELLVMKT